MGNVQTCSSTSSYEAEARDSSVKEYQWWTPYVLSAKCKDSNNKVQFDKELNIYGVILASLVLIVILWMIFKMFHKKKDAMSDFGGLGMA